MMAKRVRNTCVASDMVKILRNFGPGELTVDTMKGSPQAMLLKHTAFFLELLTETRRPVKTVVTKAIGLYSPTMLPFECGQIASQIIAVVAHARQLSKNATTGVRRPQLKPLLSLLSDKDPALAYFPSLFDGAHENTLLKKPRLLEESTPASTKHICLKKAHLLEESTSA